jgi:voltage-gated sodium channel
MKRKIEVLVNSFFFERLIVAVIILNSALIGVETYTSNESVELIQRLCLFIFTLEIILRAIASEGVKDFFSDGWNIFDLFIVLIGFIPENISENGAVFSALRVLRVFRVLRLLRASKEIKVIVNVLVKSMKSLFYNALFFLIFCYLYSLIGVTMLKIPEDIDTETKEYLASIISNGESVNPFMTVGDSFYTLFSITAGAEWWSIKGLLNAAYERGVISTPPWLVSSFLVVWYCFAVFLLLNLVLGAVINNYQMIMDSYVTDDRKNTDGIDIKKQKPID